MAIFSFLGNLFSLVTTALKGLALRWLYQRGIEKGLETAREAERKQAVKEADALAGLTEAQRRIDEQTQKALADIGGSDPLAGCVLSRPSPAVGQPGVLAGSPPTGKP